NNRGAAYQAEVSVHFHWREELEIFGRIDGIAEEGGETVIEEFKTSLETGEALPLDHEVHRLQAESYAWMWWKKQGVLPRLRLEYVHPDDSLPTRRHEWCPDPDALNARMEDLLDRWLRHQRCESLRRRERDAALCALRFPFPQMRPGQSELLEAVDRQFREGGKLYVQAPTGIGKTMGILLPALRALGQGRFQTLVIATCRNTGKRIFEEAAVHLFPASEGLRMLTLVARERICRETGSPCDCENCPLAKGFYDRLASGMAELRTRKSWTAEVWQSVAEQHRLCPFAFMMHAAREADVLLGDLNYALDPAARLEFLFGASPESVGLLIDEAHHLPDRSRGMISAALDIRMLQGALRALSPELRQTLQADLQRVLREIRRYEKEQLDEKGLPREGAGAPEGPARAVSRALEALENSFSAEKMQPGDPRLDMHRMLSGFRQSMLHRQDSHVCTQEGTVFYHLCLDASDWLRDRLGRMHAVVMFSGTLLPLEVFMRLTGAEAEDARLELPSPYPREHFPLCLEAGLPLVWKARGPELYERLARRIVAELTARAVKTLVFFPSYQLMEEVAARLPREDIWLGPVRIQPRGLQEEAAEDFLRPFREQKGPLCGLAVLGGALNEGIDLPGAALESVIVVSIGLPAICRERELMRDWYQARGEEGFMLAYTLPGLVRVLQALGRVIRGPQDRGTGLLIDPRFRHPLYGRYLGENLREETFF
ncbi:MAG: ATP-dependent DNA helicase, partial [Kiritimatiellia bacterium]